MTLRPIFPALAAIALTACSGISTIAMEGNYLTYERPFTDAAAAEVRTRAERMCGQRKQAAIKTEDVCSLSKCFTSYQCVDGAGAATSGR